MLISRIVGSVDCCFCSNVTKVFEFVVDDVCVGPFVVSRQQLGKISC